MSDRRGMSDSFRISYRLMELRKKHLLEPGDRLKTAVFGPARLDKCGSKDCRFCIEIL
jgi:hypothetical protein